MPFVGIADRKTVLEVSQIMVSLLSVIFGNEYKPMLMISFELQPNESITERVKLSELLTIKYGFKLFELKRFVVSNQLRVYGVVDVVTLTLLKNTVSPAHNEVSFPMFTIGRLSTWIVVFPEELQLLLSVTFKLYVVEFDGLTMGFSIFVFDMFVFGIQEYV